MLSGGEQSYQSEESILVHIMNTGRLLQHSYYPYSSCDQVLSFCQCSREEVSVQPFNRRLCRRTRGRLLLGARRSRPWTSPSPPHTCARAPGTDPDPATSVQPQEGPRNAPATRGSAPTSLPHRWLEEQSLARDSARGRRVDTRTGGGRSQPARGSRRCGSRPCSLRRIPAAHPSVSQTLPSARQLLREQGRHSSSNTQPC
mmetsp:Transcript_46721/g.93573  ORF Transcript_46721/g.93573 Transcript_46721/m.93573 type:complete len:201 (+) Transcript_46721:793-1395(+)